MIMMGMITLTSEHSWVKAIQAGTGLLMMMVDSLSPILSPDPMQTQIFFVMMMNSIEFLPDARRERRVETRRREHNQNTHKTGKR